MVHQTYLANDLTYTISPDAALALGQQTWALVRARTLDELIGEPPRGNLTIETTQDGASPRVAEGGLVGLAGVPTLAFPLLATQSYTVPLTLRADGYIPIDLKAVFPATPTFPDSFTPIDLGDIALHRRPTVIDGWIGLSTGIILTPVAGAIVTLTAFWRTMPPAHLIVPPDAAFVISLKPPLYFARTAPGDQVVGQNFLGPTSPDKRLLQEALAGQTLVRLSDQISIGVNDILAIDPGDPELTEYIPVQSIAGASTADQPATIALSFPLRLDHRLGAVAHRVGFAALGAPTPLAYDAIARDTCVFLPSLVNLGAADFLTVQGAGGPTEYHAVSRFTATSDAQGFYRLPPISRVAQCSLKVHDGVHADINVTVCPDYSGLESRLDFTYQ